MKTNTILSAAVIAGILTGISAVKAEEAKKDAAPAADVAKDKESCKGHKESCKGKKKHDHKKGKKDKDSCKGKEGCGEKKKEEVKTEEKK